MGWYTWLPSLQQMCGTSLHTIWPERSQRSRVNIVFDRTDNELPFKPAEKQMCVTSLYTIGPERYQQNCVNFLFDRNYNGLTLLLYEACAIESSQICPFLALRPEFHFNLRVFLSTPRYCQSATFGRLTFCVYTFFFTEFAFNVATPIARTPRPPRKPLCDKRGLHAEL